MLEKLRFKYGNLSLRNKMMISFMLVIFLIVSSLSILNINVLNRSLTNVTNEHIYQIIEQVKVRIENYTSSMAKIGTFITESKSIQSYVNLQEPINAQEKEALKVHINEVLNLYMQNEPNMSGVLYITSEDELISPNMVRLEEVALTSEFWYQETLVEPDSIHLFSKPIGRNIRSIYEFNNADNIISLTQAVRDEKGLVKGVILIDMRLDVIENIINSVSLGKNGFLYVASREGQVVFSPVNKIVHRIPNQALTVGEDVQVAQTTYQIVKSHETINGWAVVGVFNKNETLTIILQVITFFIVYAVIIIFIAILLVDFLTKSLTKPISKLRALMARAEVGELDLEFDMQYNDEIGKLGNNFNRMMVSMKHLVEEVYQAQKNIREAEIRAFQAQIKPHFLYNTLDTINWMAIEYQADDISEMITSLTDLFRISLSKGNEIISLENELKHVKSYLTIQMARYEEQFDYAFQSNENEQQLKVIKLIVQPLVENAIYHGIKESKKKGHISIRSWTEEGNLWIEVRDNGLGIEPTRLAELKKMLSGELIKPETTGIGIMNVNERLKLNFGNDYGLAMESVFGEWTTVTIKHPILNDPKEAQHNV